MGSALRESGVRREEVFITTKLWNSNQVGYDSTLQECERSLRRLGMTYVDLYLIHWPVQGNSNSIEIWRAMVWLLRQGKARAIGVSNYTVDNLNEILQEPDVVVSKCESGSLRLTITSTTITIMMMLILMMALLPSVLLRTAMIVSWC